MGNKSASCLLTGILIGAAIGGVVVGLSINGGPTTVFLQKKTAKRPKKTRRKPKRRGPVWARKACPKGYEYIGERICKPI